MQTLHKLHTEYSVGLFYEYLEYLDVHEEMKRIAQEEIEEKNKREVEKQQRR